MENFMNKLVEKISAQDIIKANAQAEAAETLRIKQEAENYKLQLEEIRQNNKDYKQQLEDNETKIHDVGVQVYRNVQAVIEKNQNSNKEEFKEIRNRLETLQVNVETKNSAVLPIAIITMLLVAADLVVNILRIVGIF